MSDGLRLQLPPDELEALVERVAALVVEKLREIEPERSPWLTGAKSAAQYLGWPTQRVFKHLHELPHYKHGHRLMFRRDELNSYLDGFREAASREGA